MGQQTSTLMPCGPDGTYTSAKDTAEDSAIESQTSSGDCKPKERRLSLKDKIRRSTSLVPSSLVATEGRGKEAKTLLPLRDTAEGISNCEAALQLTKNIVGTGILFMPKAFQAVGLWQGLIMTFLIAILTIIYFCFVVEASQHFCKIHKVSSYSYSDTVRIALEKWPALRRFARCGQHAVSALIITSCYSAVIVYVLMAAGNIRDSFLFIGWNVSLRATVALQLPFLIWANSCTSLKRVTPMTVAGLVLLWSGIGLTVYFILSDIANWGAMPVENWRSVTNLPAFFSIALFAFNGITALTAIENNMRHPAAFVGCPSVICMVVAFVAVVYSIYGMLGYLAYGTSTLGPVSNNFAPKEIAAIVLKLCIAFGLFFSCPITLFAPLSIVSDYVATWARPGHVKLWQFVSRCLQISLIVAVPLVVQDLLALMQLLGVVFTLLQFVLPVVVNALTFWDSGRSALRRTAIAVRNFILFIAGSIFVVVGFYTGVLQVIKSYS